jgi:ATP-dependent DNA helicase RecQ
MSQPTAPHRRYGTLDEARATLRAHFGYPDFRAPQIRAIEAAVAGGDALVVLPTGGGKSLCYQVPALMRHGLTVVVSPLISLMKDQVEALNRRGIAAAYLNSTLAQADATDRLARARDGTLKMLYLAPERLEAGRTLEKLAEIGVALLAVDEAHCISEWGHDFRPSYRRIGMIRERLGAPQTIALTATATPDVRIDIVKQLALRDAAVVVAGFDRVNLTYHVVTANTQHEKDRTALRWLRDAHGPAVVYAPTRKAVERLTGVLIRGGIKATAYHAGLNDRLRQRAQDAFMEERARVIVATSAFGMGIDKPDVRLVVHHAMPGAIESYYQEAGRAGRDGQPGVCMLLYSYPDRFTHEFFIKNAHPERHVVEQVWRALRGAADAAHRVPMSIEELARRRPLSSVGAREAGAALRVLISHGLCHNIAPAPGRIWIRLLASPARIRRELSGEREFDVEVLRVLWRATGARLLTGAPVDLDGLPPGLGGAIGLVPVLSRLEAQQFVSWSRTGGGYQLHPRSLSGNSLAIDWSGLERRRRTDMARLDAMQQYAQSRYCRRAYVLRYFGDPEARMHCGACDRCLGLAHGPVSLPTPTVPDGRQSVFLRAAPRRA